MRVLRFLLILLVLILFIVSNRFFCHFKLMKFTMRKNSLKTVYANDSIQQERFPVSLKVGRPIYAKTFVVKEANKLTIQVKIDTRFHRPEITYFEINRLYAYVKQIQQADYMRRNSLLIKVQV